MVMIKEYDMTLNPKHEIRNPKQNLMTKIQSIETIPNYDIVNIDLFWSFDYLEILDLFRISIFGFQISSI